MVLQSGCCCFGRRHSLIIAFIVRPVAQVSSKLLFSGLFQQRPRGIRVAHRGLRIESEDLGEVEGVEAMDESFFELPVDAELFQGGGLAAKRCGQGDRADRAGVQGGEMLISMCGLAVSGQRRRR